MRDTIVALITDVLTEQLQEQGKPIDGPLGESTRLYGREGALDSLGLVSFIVALEERIAEDLDLELTLADERAMSRTVSPFVQVGRLARYIEELSGSAD